LWTRPVCEKSLVSYFLNLLFPKSLLKSCVPMMHCAGPLLLYPSNRVVPSDPMSGCVLYTLESSTFRDRSPGSMISSLSRLLSSSLFRIRPGACVRFSVPCALESSIFLDRSPCSTIVSVPQSFFRFSFSESEHRNFANELLLLPSNYL